MVTEHAPAMEEALRLDLGAARGLEAVISNT
jgi:hypothetical protein